MGQKRVPVQCSVSRSPGTGVVGRCSRTLLYSPLFLDFISFPLTALEFVRAASIVPRRDPVRGRNVSRFHALVSSVINTAYWCLGPSFVTLAMLHSTAITYVTTLHVLNFPWPCFPPIHLFSRLSADVSALSHQVERRSRQT